MEYVLEPELRARSNRVGPHEAVFIGKPAEKLTICLLWGLTVDSFLVDTTH